ncbi:hypothetical protein J3F83DRAFT_699663 [Trichoderma novae-zelandiae]
MFISLLLTVTYSNLAIMATIVTNTLIPIDNFIVYSITQIPKTKRPTTDKSGIISYTETTKRKGNFCFDQNQTGGYPCAQKPIYSVERCPKRRKINSIEMQGNKETRGMCVWCLRLSR